MTDADKYQIPRTLKTEWTGYLVFTIIFGILAIPGILSVFEDVSSWPILLVEALILGFVLIWLGARKVVLKDDRIFIQFSYLLFWRFSGPLP